ncbi:hypothetical protein EFT49_05065 [Leuconostoc falkenbergense]|uniref:hypothetical protein n=1 Tax=Leuconostoc falkenbergense TaxID=2766470 RepID=UPI0021AAE8D9|nr:hypothetical protein [Leuconostoc falkenbergense]MCT4419586.1 hypothetical protein [Leuconostoc falkenbergense]
MKFTEEQYQKIVEVQEEHFQTTIISEGRLINDGGFWNVVSEKMPLLSEYVSSNDLHFELAAIANPLTREWAHDKFVEEEKKYYWTGNKVDNVGFIKRLYKDDDGMIIDHVIRKEDTDKAEDEQLTESEIKAWGYNPEMFDREEVQ